MGLPVTTWLVIVTKGVLLDGKENSVMKVLVVIVHVLNHFINEMLNHAKTQNRDCSLIILEFSPYFTAHYYSNGFQLKF